MFLSYTLPTGAPETRVWYVVCDAHGCGSFIGPLADLRDRDQRKTVEDAGWSYSNKHPYDLCVDCRQEAGR